VLHVADNVYVMRIHISRLHEYSYRECGFSLIEFPVCTVELPK
jgi:hypothetical protein